MVPMPLATIIREIDAYLERLEQARDLLAQSLIPIHRSRANRRREATERQPHIEGRNNVRRDKQSPAPPRRPVRNSKPTAATIDVDSQPQASESCDASLAGESPAALPQQAQQANQSSASSGRKENRPAAARRRKSLRVGRRPMMAKQEKPAKALSRPPVSGWIAVSPEVAKRAREHAVPAGPISFVAPATALAGRRAFEVLFGNGAGASGTLSE
jgi:hypothetical protein